MRAKRRGPQCQDNKFYPHFLERHGEREWMRGSLERLRAARVSHFQLVVRVWQ